MDGILEQQRRAHEERERLVDTTVREWLHEKKTHKEKINSEHRLKLLFTRHNEATQKLKDLYEDRDGARKEEVSAIGAPNEFTEFYNRLKVLKDFHRNHPNEISIPLSVEFQEMNETIEDPNRLETDLVEFTDEEGYGRYLDMHYLHDRYLNLKGAQKLDYLTYISNFDRLFDYPKDKKLNTDYRQYAANMLEYLCDFISRVKPLLDMNEEISKAMTDFESKFNDGSFPGWPKVEQTPKSALVQAVGGGYLDLSPFNTAEELMALGLDRLKSALTALGLKCGGTAEERAKRLLLTKGKRLEDLDPSLFAKASSIQQMRKETSEMEKQREVAELEAQIYHFSELISEQREATKENVERKQARVPGEDEELEDEEAPPVPSDDEDDDDIPYNPKNLPLGWDGKPIPYWLYKLHGLNINFPCEICGNQVYKGPKAFQRHFSEWRHAHGMRCLGIPNTAHFANVTKIHEALELWERLREQKDLERFRPEVEEEYEDSQGNVVNKKTYDDLRRQGLL